MEAMMTRAMAVAMAADPEGVAEAMLDARCRFETAFSRNRETARNLREQERREKRRERSRARADAYRSAGMVRTKYGWE